MKTDWTVESLIAFEDDVAAEFNVGNIRAPVHLSKGNEVQLLRIFEDVRPQDWCCCTWRSHFACLLKGVPPERLKADIIAGKSITLNYPDFKIISSAMVGGIIPIALGIAWAAKWRGSDENVWVLAGDMAARGGLYHECVQYASGHALPITFVIEDNGLSVNTGTDKSWGTEHKLDVRTYSYKLLVPHVGTGTFVKFPDIEHRSHGL